ncbi:MAG TPA: hypothetical protein DCQ93_01915 [Bacteroidetes bacterium]|nr:hypothetical protein [Bacteroidota bacterium]
MKSVLLAAFTLILSLQSFSQTKSKSDSLINAIMHDQDATAPQNEGISLIKSNNFSGANTFFSNQIANDPTNTNAYLNRGVTQWQMNEPANACKDWSALLALGDTAAFKLLDGKCHGQMIVEKDTLPKSVYHKLFSEKKDSKSMNDNSGAMTFVEEMPEFPGGDKALLSYLASNLKYPASAKSKNIQGTVVINFIVSSQGTILFPYIKKSLNAECDKEALRVISNMPKWKPGKQNGKATLVRYNLPVKFEL